jgi:hypothetical protein
MKGKNKMQIGTILKPDGTTKEIRPQKNGTFGLAEMQDAVGGFIEIVKLKPGTPYALLVINEEGKLLSMPCNPKATELAELQPDDCIVGNALLIASSPVTYGKPLCDVSSSKVETLRISCAMFCALIDAWVDGEISDLILIARMHRARNEVLAALPELNEELSRQRQHRRTI